MTHSDPNRPAKLHRAVAVHGPGHPAGAHTEVRDFLTRRARNRWADGRQRGREEIPPSPGAFDNDEGLPAVPPALSVKRLASKLVTFEADQ